MKPLRFLLPALLLASAVTACTDEATLAVSHADAISFRTAVDSRAQEITAASLESFAVTAILPDGAPYFDAARFVAEQEGATTFVADGSPILWPGDKALTFYAYAGLPDGATPSFAADGSAMTLPFTPALDASAQTDLIVASATGQRSADGGGDTTIPLNFRHALTQISVLAKSSNTAISYAVSGVRLGGLLASSTLTLDPEGNISWSETATADAPARTPFSSALDAEKILTAQPTAVGETFMVIPETEHPAWGGNDSSTDDGAYIALLLQINIAGQQGYEGWAAVPVSADWLPGHHYTYTLDLSRGAGRVAPDQDLTDWTTGELILGSDITLTASISDWSDATGSEIIGPFENPELDPSDPLYPAALEAARTNLHNILNRPIFFPEDAIADAQTVYDNPDATLKEVTNAYTALMASFQTTLVVLHGQAGENRDRKYLDIDDSQTYGIWTLVPNENGITQTMVWEISRFSSRAGGETYYVKNVATGKYLGHAFEDYKVILSDVPTIYGIDFGPTSGSTTVLNEFNQIGLKMGNADDGYFNFRNPANQYFLNWTFDNGSSFIAKAPPVFDNPICTVAFANTDDTEAITSLSLETEQSADVAVRILREDNTEFEGHAGVDITVNDAQGNPVDWYTVNGQTVTIRPLDPGTYSIVVSAGTSANVRIPSTSMTVTVTASEQYTLRQPVRDLYHRPIFFDEATLADAHDFLYSGEIITEADVTAYVATMKTRFQTTCVLLHGQLGGRDSHYLYALEDGSGMKWTAITASNPLTYGMIWEISYDKEVDGFYIRNLRFNKYVSNTRTNNAVDLSETPVPYEINFGITSNNANNLNQVGFKMGTGNDSYINHTGNGNLGTWSFDNGSSFIAEEVPEWLMAEAPSE